MKQPGRELVDQYHINKNYLELAANEIESMKEQLKAKEIEYEIMENKLKTIREAAPELIKYLDKEYEIEE